MKRHIVSMAPLLVSLMGLGCDEYPTRPGEVTVESPIMTEPSQGPVVEVPGARAQFTTSNAGARVTFQTSELDPDHAHTLWWVVFNNPDACENDPCTEEDLVLRGDAAQAEVTHAAGIVASPDGGATLTARLDGGEVANGWFGIGFINPRGAEIHMVLRDHGPVITELLEDQLSTFRGGCTDESVPDVLPPAVDRKSVV